MSYARNGRDGDWVPTECGPRILPDTPDRVCTAGDGLPLPPSPNLKRDRRPTVGLGDGGEARGRTPGRGRRATTTADRGTAAGSTPPRPPASRRWGCTP